MQNKLLISKIMTLYRKISCLTAKKFRTRSSNAEPAADVKKIYSSRVPTTSPSRIQTLSTIALDLFSALRVKGVNLQEYGGNFAQMLASACDFAPGSSILFEVVFAFKFPWLFSSSNKLLSVDAK